MTTSFQAGDRRRGRAPRVALAVLAGLALTAGALYFTGVYDGWADDTGAPDQLCGGLVERDDADLRRLLGARELSPADVVTDRTSDEPRACAFRPRSEAAGTRFGDLDVTVSRDAGSKELLLALRRRQSDSMTATVSPVGNGWRGVLNTDPGSSHAAVVMLCEGERPSDLTVNLTGRPAGYDSRLPTEEQRTRLARLTTRIAVRAAQQAGCEAPRGETIHSVADPMPSPVDDPKTRAVPAGEATGTCEGVAAPTTGTEADPLAPIEDCLIIGTAGKPVFRLAAYYGPYVQEGHVATEGRGDRGTFTGPAGGTDGLFWASATCAAQGGPAFFTSETLATGDGHTSPDPALQQSALRRFAERSAKDHGCEAPVFGE
ncbi:hypothetical protein [Streptomyces sp. KAU_LT]|uniref:hypothetical protein n=1 Tax=unclassified Streptomyces TaxID=2593676 RepID=UPI0024B794B7|nr:hypothetical protein [Streptomyces sp. KAU_LT]MDI9832218.1 hypothetical protein [Streptomyces sp. KAU_LT]